MRESKSHELLLSEIDDRNRLRSGAGLPLLSLEAELQKAIRVKETNHYRSFVYGSLRFRVRQKLLDRERRRRSCPGWVPQGVFQGGWAFEVKVTRQMRRLYGRLRSRAAC